MNKRMLNFKRRWKFTTISAILIVSVFSLSHIFRACQSDRMPAERQAATGLRTIQDTIDRGDTLYAIFKKNDLNLADLFSIRQAAASVHDLRRLNHGQRYTIAADNDNCVDSLLYWIDDDYFLKVKRVESGFQAERRRIPYESHILTLSGSIEDNLVSSFKNTLGKMENLLVKALTSCATSPS